MNPQQQRQQQQQPQPPQQQQDRINVIVYGPEGRYTLKVQRDDSIWGMKIMLYPLCGIHPDSQVLKYRGFELLNGYSLDFYEWFKNNIRIYLTTPKRRTPDPDADKKDGNNAPRRPDVLGPDALGRGHVQTGFGRGVANVRRAGPAL